ncbi:unnamed protein product [Medioppia subpectinata]|uniref:G-protein coupled receptors family 1 profile domain-containing protein n=1 Tax=Medioppia subpectinata TaxID=1979941 RepID=A0A7R9KVH6_9ACAR|nr:unnamed protein product [Medioppia subpectinata]CAG2109444.1 unnamed protein product [Medioppia subpectinata]
MALYTGYDGWRDRRVFMERLARNLCIPSDDNKYFRIAVVLKFLIPFSIIIPLYIGVYKKSIEYQNRILRQQTFIRRDVILRREFRVARSLAVITAVFAICLLPLNVMFLVTDAKTIHLKPMHAINSHRSIPFGHKKGVLIKQKQDLLVGNDLLFVDIPTTHQYVANAGLERPSGKSLEYQNRILRQQTFIRRDVILRREFRVARSLAVITAVFAICLLPLNVMFLVTDAKTIHLKPMHAINAVVWLLYLNSTLNPILYALLNRDFRIIAKEQHR